MPMRCLPVSATAGLPRRSRWSRPHVLTALALLAGGASWPAGGAQLTLSTAPPAVTGKGPVPNVILSVDDSGSMGSKISSEDTRTRMAVLIAVLKRQFGDSSSNKGRTPDDSIRLAWQAMNRTNTLTAGGTNSLRTFSGTHRTNFNTFVNGLYASGGTPLHQMHANAIAYMKTAPGVDSPWADAPGATPAQATSTYLTCRKAFHILLTDGEPNGYTHTGSIFDGTTRLLPDNINSYDATSAQTRIFRDNLNLLADYGFESWATDLQPSIDNGLTPVMRVTGNETHGAVSLQPYWNPKNDPATWQHMNVFTIGFGSSVVAKASGPRWNTTNGDNYSGDYSAVIQGTQSWTSTETTNLWRVALNSRGRFYLALTETELDTAFDEIFAEIKARSTATLSSVTASARSLTVGLSAFKASFVPGSWTGDLSAFTVNATTGAVSTTEAWSAAAKLDAPGFDPATRFVLGFNGTDGFAWNDYSTLPSAQQTPLNRNAAGTVDNRGADRLAFLRGVRNTALITSGVLRDRESRLGDFVNSQPWYVGAPSAAQSSAAYATFRSTYRNRTPMVYIGGNGGFLHGFAAGGASAGAELLAYVPKGIAEGPLRTLADPGYTHRYFVDGSPFTGDANLGGTLGWRTVLVGSPGLGGRGYFALDVTQPSDFTTAKAANLVLLDTTSGTDADIGHIVGPPAADPTVDGQSAQIVKLNNGRWAVLLGNGVNSVNEKPVLLVQYLDGSKTLLKLSPCPATGSCSWGGTNGLGTPLPVDLDGNGTVDVVYAGDLRGHVWRFDLDSATDTNWHVGFGGDPLFVAQPATGVRQAITAPPMAYRHPRGGLMVLVGTGSLNTDSDRSSSQQHALYGLYDNSVIGFSGSSLSIADGTVINTTAATALPSTLVQQTVTGSVTISGRGYRTGSSNAVNYASGARGWYMNLPDTGQRSLAQPAFWFGSLAAFAATIPGQASTPPAGGSCSYSVPQDQSSLFVLDILSGAPSTKPLVAGSTNVSVVGFANRGNSELTLHTRDSIVRAATDGSGVDSFAKLPSMGVRLNWQAR